MLRDSLLSRHVRDGKVTFGINHEIRDYQHNRKKDLDLVICRRGDPVSVGGVSSFAEMVDTYTIDLTPAALDTERRRDTGELGEALPCDAVAIALPSANDAPPAFSRAGLNISSSCSYSVPAQAGTWLPISMTVPDRKVIASNARRFSDELSNTKARSERSTACLISAWLRS